MAKIFLKKMAEKSKMKSDIEKAKRILKEHYACYVLITCSDPSLDGSMDVEMNYEGDEILASYLVESAKNVFDVKCINP